MFPPFYVYALLQVYHKWGRLVIVAHNHPSREVSPSKQDIEMAQQFIAPGQLLGVPLQDHVIITEKDHYSFKFYVLI